MREFDEIQAIMATEQKNCEELWEAITRILKDSFIYEATEYGIKRWEQIINLKPKDTDTLEIRKFRIIAKINEEMPYTYKKLEKQLETLCGKYGYQLSIDQQLYVLKVRVALTARQKVDEVEALLDRIVPCHLIIDINLMYNQHKTLIKQTHKMLHQYTHKQLREEVMG